VINTFKTGDDKWLTVTSGTPRSVVNVAELVGEPLEDYATPAMQVANREKLDRLVGEWISTRTLAECLETMRRLDVVASGIYTVEDILSDITYQERENITTVQDPDLGPVRMQNVIPKLTNYTGEIWRSAPSLGQDNDFVYGDLLGMSGERLSQLSSDGTV